MTAQEKSKYVNDLIELGVKKERLAKIINVSRPTFRRKVKDADFDATEIAALQKAFAGK